jgi:hypothetical protein
MPPEVVAEKAKHAAQSLSRLLRQHAPAEGQVDDVEAYVILADFIGDRIRSDWGRLQAQLAAGVDAETARSQGAALCVAADTWSAIAQSLQDLAAVVRRETGELVAGVEELAEEAVQIVAIHGAARRVVDSVNAALAEPLDQDMLAHSETDTAAGRLHKGQELIGRLRSRKSP